MDKDENTIKNIIELTKVYLKNDSIKIINDSYDYISMYLDNDKLKNTLDIITILTTINADYETIVATFLYQLFLNNSVSRTDLEKKYDFNIVKLAYGVYKLNKINFSTENDYLIDYYKKVIVGMCEDVRVIIISLAERVNQMLKLKNLSIDEARKISKETLEIFAPIAHHLGVYKLKSELEDLSFQYLKPNIYNDILEKINSTKVERDNIINKMMNEVSTILTDHNIIHEIKGRSKSIYSIYNKLDKGRKFSDIYDLLAIRILVKSEIECYLVLGLIHSKFKPITKRFKDFIAMPKTNGYESLHTTVFGYNNELFEIQIRTYEMNETAENGLAAHWSYKENKNANYLSSTDAKLGFFKTVIDMNKEENSREAIYNAIKEDGKDDNIYVFTPKGDVIELPKGSTPIDFAYRVHSKIGDKMIGALVNNVIVPLNYVLQDNDVIKINTSNSSVGPSEDWLGFVKLTQTKNKIKAFFNKNRKEELSTLGKEILDKELRKRKINLVDFYSNNNIKKILKELKIKDIINVYVGIGSNKYNPKYIINIINEEKVESNSTNQIINKNDLDINVSGLTDIKVNIASCCNPIPGDKIIGYITKTNGITVHRENCEKVILLDERLVDVCFNQITKNKYLTSITITLKNNQNKLGDILNKINNNYINIDNIKSMYRNNVSVYKIELYVSNLKVLEKIINDINKLRYVKDVERN